MMELSMSHSLESSLLKPREPDIHCPHFFQHSGLRMLTRVTIKWRLQHSGVSPALISKLFCLPPINRFQRLTNHMVRFDLSDQSHLWYPCSVIVAFVSLTNRGNTREERLMV